MILYYKDKNDKKIIINDNIKTCEEALQEIANYLRKKEYPCYYIRHWREKDKNIWTFDFGSYSTFMYLEEEEEVYVKLKDVLNLIPEDDIVGPKPTYLRKSILQLEQFKL